MLSLAQKLDSAQVPKPPTHTLWLKGQGLWHLSCPEIQRVSLLSRSPWVFSRPLRNSQAWRNIRTTTYSCSRREALSETGFQSRARNPTGASNWDLSEKATGNCFAVLQHFSHLEQTAPSLAFSSSVLILTSHVQTPHPIPKDFESSPAFTANSQSNFDLLSNKISFLNLLSIFLAYERPLTRSTSKLNS